MKQTTEQINEKQGQMFLNDKPIDVFRIQLRSGKELEYNRYADPWDKVKVYFRTYREDLRIFIFWGQSEETITIPMEAIDYYSEVEFRTK